MVFHADGKANTNLKNGKKGKERDANPVRIGNTEKKKNKITGNPTLTSKKGGGGGKNGLRSPGGGVLTAFP